MILSRIGFLVVIICFLRSSVMASDTLVLRGDLSKDFVVSNQYLHVFEDPSCKIQPEEVVEEKPGIQFNAPTYNFNINRNSVYWIKIIVKNSSGPFDHFILENYYNHTDDFKLFYKEGDKLYVQKSGQGTIYQFRDYRHKNLIFDIPVKRGETKPIYIRIQSKLYTDFNFRLKSFHYFTTYTTSEYMLLGIYYGILIIMALYNLILFFTIRSRIYLLYICYVCAGILVSLNEDKLGYQYLWPSHPSLNPLLSYFVAPTLLIFTFLVYSTEFLELRKRIRKLYNLVWILFGIYLIFFVVNFFYPTDVILRFLYVLPFIAVLVSSILVFVRGHKSARFLIVGASLIFLSVLLIQLRAENLLPGTLFTVYILNYSLIAETVILSIALSDRIKIIQRDKEFAQQKVIIELEENKKLQNFVNLQLQEKKVLQEKVNKELEQKVNERTQQLELKTNELEKSKQELEVANDKLKSLIDQANSMNVKLDLDNWQLKKNVQQGLLQRITGDEVSFEIFKTVFKDDLTCLRFLDEIKWAQGFACKKCGYEKYKEIDGSLIRKCSRCGYTESVTSGTLLHGIKFPINSALYLVYIIHRKSGKVRLDHISEIAGISNVSASKFKTKIISKMEILIKKKKEITWEEIIF